MVTEWKQKPDGSWRTFGCLLVHDERPRLMVVRFVMEPGGSVFGTPFEIPPGSISDGYFWARRPYNLYRLRRPDGRLIAHRLDAVADVRLGDTEIRYRDLVLDWWVGPDDRIVEEDRDELDELVRGELICAADVRAATAATVQVLGRYRHIIDEAERIERAHGLAPVLRE